MPSSRPRRTNHLLARDEDLPSGDELGAEFERFLAARDKRKEGFQDGDEGN
jgi:hypothetical protein